MDLSVIRHFEQLSAQFAQIEISFDEIQAFSNAEQLIVSKKTVALSGGNVHRARFLAKMLYWQERTKSKDGFFYVTLEELKKQCFLKRYWIDNAREFFGRLGILETARRRVAGKTAVVVHYRLDLAKIAQLLELLVKEAKATGKLESDLKTQHQKEAFYARKKARVAYAELQNNVKRQKAIAAETEKRKAQAKQAKAQAEQVQTSNETFFKPQETEISEYRKRRTAELKTAGLGAILVALTVQKEIDEKFGKK